MVKKSILYVKLFIFLVWGLAGCNGTGSNYSDGSSQTTSVTVEQPSHLYSETHSSSSYTTNVDIKKAAITAQDFVEDRLGKCNFPLLDVRGEELSTNYFKVMQKFTRKADGEQYIYRIYIKYNGGEWEDRNNWTVNGLTIENTMTGRQYHY